MNHEYMMTILVLLLAAAPTPEVACQAYEAGPARERCIQVATDAAEHQWKMGVAAAAQAEAGRLKAEDKTRRWAAEALERIAKRRADGGVPVETDSDWMKRAIAEAPPDDPKELQLVWSARICDRLVERAQAVAAIAKEHRYSKIGGALHLNRLGELQDDVASADDDIAEIRSELKAISKRPLPCNNPGVVQHRQ
jgi:hypothetical protein